LPERILGIQPGEHRDMAAFQQGFKEHNFGRIRGAENMELVIRAIPVDPPIPRERGQRRMPIMSTWPACTRGTILDYNVITHSPPTQNFYPAQHLSNPSTCPTGSARQLNLSAT
jgi:hypothetical protein